MTEQNDRAADLKVLEERIDELVEIVNKLTTENTALRVRQDNMTTERAELIEKTELAKSRIEAMISRLRAMEIRS